MCIIVYKPNNVEMPSVDILQTCATNNKDGMGIAWKNQDGLYYSKGFMTFEDFSEYIFNMGKYVDFEKSEVALHFRIATSGGVNIEKCHPFPISQSFEDMEKAEGKTKALLFHNGVVGQGSKSHSDTEYFIKEKIYPAISDYKKVKDILEKEKGQRFVLMSENNETIISGSWEKEGSIYYSNYSYIPYNTKYSFQDDYFEDDILYILQDVYDLSKDRIVSDRLRKAIEYAYQVALEESYIL